MLKNFTFLEQTPSWTFLFILVCIHKKNIIKYSDKKGSDPGQFFIYSYFAQIFTK
jgi:hypothetical protein